MTHVVHWILIPSLVGTSVVSTVGCWLIVVVGRLNHVGHNIHDLLLARLAVFVVLLTLSGIFHSEVFSFGLGLISSSIEATNI